MMSLRLLERFVINPPQSYEQKHRGQELLLLVLASIMPEQKYCVQTIWSWLNVDCVKHLWRLYVCKDRPTWAFVPSHLADGNCQEPTGLWSESPWTSVQDSCPVFQNSFSSPQSQVSNSELWWVISLLPPTKSCCWTVVTKLTNTIPKKTHRMFDITWRSYLTRLHAHHNIHMFCIYGAESMNRVCNNAVTMQMLCGAKEAGNAYPKTMLMLRRYIIQDY